MTTKVPWQEPLAQKLKELDMAGTARDVKTGQISMSGALARIGKRLKDNRQSADWKEQAQNVIDGYQADGLGGDRG